MKAFWLAAFLIAIGGVPQTASASGVIQVAGVDQSPGTRVPLDLAFRDADGRAVTLRGISDGKPFLLIPVLHRCPNNCDGMLDGVAAAVMALPRGSRDHLAIIAFGIDPREQPEDAKATLKALHSHYPGLATVAALTGDRENIAAVADAIGYHYTWNDKAAQFDHVAATAVVTGDGFLGRWLYGPGPTTGELSLALDEAGAGQTGSLSDHMLLLCYHYDPAKGCYSLFMPGVLRVGTGATVLLLAGFVGRALRKEHAG